MEKYISKIEKEFDAVYSGITYPFDSKENQAVEAERKVFKSFLKQSFIKYLQSQVDRHKARIVDLKERQPHHTNDVVDYMQGSIETLVDEINTLQAQIKELNENK